VEQSRGSAITRGDSPPKRESDALAKSAKATRAPLTDSPPPGATLEFH